MATTVLTHLTPPTVPSSFASRSFAMGGSAFNNMLPDANFPRLSPETYQTLKAKITLHLRDLYKYVEVPHEAPGKIDHGDIDFVVCQPRDGLTHEDVRRALGAQESIASDNIRMSNFAIRLEDAGEHDYYQVDVEVCDDYKQFDHAVFWCSYGDMGMILGLMARAVNLSLGRHGLKVRHTTTACPQTLSAT
jgi:hypothetical protein